ncbi:esterase B1-like [Bradysia coprophila]|uniref:esterase B1-like n=1 Tax=Bradysia coprophila TaxID=38358 RepID=UPI00187DAE94|nr:esterase B1-like [Bradysia coprophila]
MSENTKIVQTTKGPVKGILKTSTVGEEYYRFRGIPYARPPVGDLRFKDPQPVEAWTTPVDATSQGPTAIAFNFVTFGLNEGRSEDCLTLNVYTKDITPTKPLPVMVFIHGGAFKYGDTTENSYGPDYLLEKNVVFVSINYRLGAFGFLSIPDPSINIPGNAGLKDQRMALQWVRDNIHAFGGDNKNITKLSYSLEQHLLTGAIFHN